MAVTSGTNCRYWYYCLYDCTAAVATDLIRRKIKDARYKDKLPAAHSTEHTTGPVGSIDGQNPITSQRRACQASIPNNTLSERAWRNLSHGHHFQAPRRSLRWRISTTAVSENRSRWCGYGAFRRLSEYHLIHVVLVTFWSYDLAIIYRTRE